MSLRLLGFAGSAAVRHVGLSAPRRALCARRFVSMADGRDGPEIPAKCVGCEGLTETFSKAELGAYAGVLGNWSVVDDGKKLTKLFRAKNFPTALDYLNKVGALAEAEGHHPDLRLFGYNNILLELSTHSLGGLTVNDIVMAVKIDALPPVPLSRRPPDLPGPGRKDK